MGAVRYLLHDGRVMLCRTWYFNTQEWRRLRVHIRGSLIRALIGAMFSTFLLVSFLVYGIILNCVFESMSGYFVLYRFLLLHPSMHCLFPSLGVRSDASVLVPLDGVDYHQSDVERHHCPHLCQLRSEAVLPDLWSAGASRGSASSLHHWYAPSAGHNYSSLPKTFIYTIFYTRSRYFKNLEIPFLVLFIFCFLYFYNTLFYCLSVLKVLFSESSQFTCL